MNSKVVLITGASSGIGLETALLLIQEGYHVYAGARRIDQMKDIENAGGHPLFLDVTNEKSMKECIDFILNQEGHIDVLINNAGYGSCGAIEDIPMQEVKNQYEVNVFGLGRITQLVLPSMRKQKSGKIINISSMGGRFTSPYSGWYHSTKYAVESISDALRMELKPWNIDVVLVEPGMIQTDWGLIAEDNLRKYSGTSDYKDYADKVATFYKTLYKDKKGRLTEPSIVARVIKKAVLAKKPKTRYLVGKNAKTYIIFKRILGDRLYERITLITMGMGGINIK